MAAQKGKDLLLKIDDGGAGFITVAGLRARTLSFNAETIDITNQDSAGQWRELLAGASVRTARVTGSGIFKDAASDAEIRTAFFNGVIKTWQIVVPDFGIVQGAFQINSFELTGKHDGEVGFDLALESAAELTFTAI